MKIDIKIKFWDFVFTSFLSFFFTTKVYSFLYPQIGYTNLDDFYVGVSIFENHNKYLDIYIYFIYLLLFFMTYPFISFVHNKIIKEKNNITEFKFLEKIKSILLKFTKIQYLFVFGYIFLHPLNGNLYPRLTIFIILLMILSFIDIYRRNKKNEGFSPFSLCALFFIFAFSSYITDIAPTDDHHYGETFATFLMHNNFNLEYYKDIMLVHGVKDIVPPFLGNFFFEQNNIYGYCLGEYLQRNIIFIITFICTLYVFDKNLLYTMPVFILRISSVTVMFFSIYMLFIKSLKKPVLWFWSYIICAILFSAYWTTIGSFWIIASMPVFVYICLKLKNKKLHLYSAGVLLLVLSIIFRNEFFEYLHQAKYYIEGTLYAFGNDFIDIRNKSFIQLSFEWIYKLSALFFAPVLIIEGIKQFKNKNREFNTIFYLLFSILIIIISLKYTLGRVDNGMFQRVEFISFPFLCVIIPYWFYKLADKEQKIVFEKTLIIFLIIIFPIYLFYSIPKKIENYNKPKYITNSQLNNIGDIKLNLDNEKRIEEINNYLKDKNGIFLDLTNRGMHYLYVNKPIPIQFTSFYNSIKSNQALESVDRLRKNIPESILIYSNNLIFDGVFPSLRINPLYRWIFLKQKYKFISTGNNVFLEKTKDDPQYTQEQLDELDYYFSTPHLKFLPEVWANSIKTLPILKITTNFNIQIYRNIIKIKFDTPKQVRNIDLLYVNLANKKGITNFKIYINNSKSYITCQSKTGKILLPMDNFPSWLLNDSLTEITIETNSSIQTAEIELFKRKFNI